MFEPGDLNAFSYWAHLLVGLAGLLGALLALLAAKGKKTHKAGGWIFIAGASTAALTALHFQFTRFAAPPVLNSLEAFVGISAALLALRRRTATVYRAELALAGVNVVLLVAFLALAIPAMRRGIALPINVAGVALVPIVFLLGDIRYLPNRGHGVQLSRHLSRMAWVLAIALRAPLVEVWDDFGLPQGIQAAPLLLPPLLLWVFRKQIGLGSKGSGR